MHIEVITEIIIAMFALYGVFCSIQLLSELLFPPSAFTLAVFARRGETAKDIYNRLCYAQLIAARERGAKIYPVIIADESYMDSEEKLGEFRKMGVALYTANEI